MNLDRFNLNLFVAFEALSKADTLTQAAGALCVTQSTLSVALRQMREYFDDELFVYKPKQKELTPLAHNLRPRVLEILKTAKATLMLKEETASFDRTRCLALVPDDPLSGIVSESPAALSSPIRTSSTTCRRFSPSPPRGTSGTSPASSPMMGTTDGRAMMEPY